MGGWAHTSHPSRIIVTSRELFPKWKPGEVDDNSIVALELHPHLQQLIRGGSRHPACKLLSDWRTGPS